MSSLYIDSLSPNLFYSSMPQTQHVLRAVESSGRGRVYDFRQHRLAGHGTAGNVPVMMVGERGTPNSRWIFDEARDFGFATLLSTEECAFAQNSIARLQAGFPGGFGSKLTPKQQQKTLAILEKTADHIGLPKEFCNVENMYRDVKAKWWDMSARMCIAGKYIHEHILDYAGKFLKSKGYADAFVPLFAQMHLNAGHESTCVGCAHLMRHCTFFG